MMLIGTVSAIAHGTALPLLFLYFGDLVDSFIFQEISSRIAQNISDTIGMEVNCSSNFSLMLDENTTLTTIDTVLRGTFQLASANCLLGDDFIREINITTFIFVGIGVAVLIGAFLQITTFQLSAERQVYKIRIKYYRAIMRQNIAWFDENPSGALINRLSE